MDESSPVYENFMNKMSTMSGRPKINRTTFNIGANVLERRVANNSRKITIIKSKNDTRSYRLISQKLIKIGFKPKKGIIFAIKELKKLYLMKKLKNKPYYHSVLWLKKLIKHA